MRHISFFLTQRQVREQTKTVTRRLGWHWLSAGTLLQPVVKGQGIPRGGKVEKIGGPIRVVSVERERLNALLSVITDQTMSAAKVSTCTRLRAVGYQLVHQRCFASTTVARLATTSRALNSSTRSHGAIAGGGTGEPSGRSLHLRPRMGVAPFEGERHGAVRPAAHCPGDAVDS
jgi:hypothetical protein